MKTALTIATLIALSSTANAAGYIKIEGIKGESVDSVDCPRDAASGMPTGKRQHQPVSGGVTHADSWAGNAKFLPDGTPCRANSAGKSFEGGNMKGERTADYNSSRSNKR